MADANFDARAATARAVTAALSAAHHDERPSPDEPSRTGPLDIAIPVFNNAAQVERCLESLSPTLADDDVVWLLDDASDEPGTRGLLLDFAERRPGTRVVTQPVNLGFVGTSNHAFDLTRRDPSRDMVLLNSDTVVTAGWLERLQHALSCNPRAGIVCPVSNRATLLSVLPDAAEASLGATARAAAAATLGDPCLPTAAGFCMLLRRDMLNELGGFSEAFAPGYGEENDLSMRALRAGWDVVVADRATVWHHSGGSFEPGRRQALQIEHQARLDRIWPEYGPLVRAWWRDNPLRAKTERMAWLGDHRPGVLHLLHRQYHVGGTERVARMLVRELGDGYRHTLVYPGVTGNAWCDAELRAAGPTRELMLNKRWIRPATHIGGHGADLGCAHSERALVRLIRGSQAEIVHFHHLLHWDSLALPAVARALGCRIVISVHDFWFNCPIHNQLEHATGQPCGRRRLQADARCGSCVRAWGLERRHGEYAEARHGLVQHMLGQADAVLVPSRFIRDKILAAYSLAPGTQLHLQPHGVEAAQAPPRRKRPGPGTVLGYFGGDQVLKGARLALAIGAALETENVTVRVHGRIKGFDERAIPPNVELRGFYDPDRVGEIMADVDLALVPSHYEESFSLTVSECWAHGVPVLASDRGALAERVQPGVNGWLVEDMTAESWIRAVRQALRGDALERCRERLARRPVTTIRDSAAALDRVYRDLLDRAPLPAAEPGEPTAPAGFQRRLESLRTTPTPHRPAPGHRALGVMRDRWGTAHYRIRFPLVDLARPRGSDPAAFHVIRESGFALGPALAASAARHVLLQPMLSDEGLQLAESLHRDGAIRVTLVIDDLWTGMHADNPARRQAPPDLAERLAYAVSLSRSVVLTTPELKRRLTLRHDHVRVIDNALPAWIWGDQRVARRPGRERLRIGWAGAPQHAADLAFLEPVMRATTELADWVFLGMCPDALQPWAAEVHPMVPFDRYPATLARLGLDLAIAPLTDTPFNRCKSHLKVLECGILGIPVIAADLEPYRHCPVPLAPPDDADAWITCIRDWLTDAEARESLGTSLQSWVRGNHMTENRRPDWRAALGIDTYAD